MFERKTMWSVVLLVALAGFVGAEVMEIEGEQQCGSYIEASDDGTVLFCEGAMRANDLGFISCNYTCTVKSFRISIPAF